MKIGQRSIEIGFQIYPIDRSCSLELYEALSKCLCENLTLSRWHALTYGLKVSFWVVNGNPHGVIGNKFYEVGIDRQVETLCEIRDMIYDALHNANSGLNKEVWAIDFWFNFDGKKFLKDTIYNRNNWDRGK